MYIFLIRERKEISDLGKHPCLPLKNIYHLLENSTPLSLFHVQNIIHLPLKIANTPEKGFVDFLSQTNYMELLNEDKVW